MRIPQWKLDAAALDIALRLPEEVQKDINMDYLAEKVFGTVDAFQLMKSIRKLNP